MTYTLIARRMAAIVLVTAGLVTTVGVPTASGAPPLDASAAVCQRDGGVYVYAQYPGRGFVARGCTPAGESGYRHLMRLTSIKTKGGALCQIGGVPDTCTFDSSTTIYWSYWQWSGGSWHYSNEGGGTYTGAPGSVEAWFWGNGAPPPFTPPAPASAAKPPAPKPPAPKKSASKPPAKAKPGPRKPSASDPKAPAKKPPAGTKPKATTKPPAADSSARRPATKPPAASRQPEPTGSRRPSPQTPANSTPTRTDASASTPATARPSSPETPTSAEPTVNGVAYVADDSSGGPWATIGTVGFLAAAGVGYGVFRATRKRRA